MGVRRRVALFMVWFLAAGHLKEARALLARGDQEGAYAAYRRSVGLAPDCVEAWRGILGTSVALGWRPSAAEAARELAQLGHEDDEVWGVVRAELRECLRACGGGEPGVEEAERFLRELRNAGVTVAQCLKIAGIPSRINRAERITGNSYAELVRLAPTVDCVHEKIVLATARGLLLGGPARHEDGQVSHLALLQMHDVVVPALEFLEEYATALDEVERQVGPAALKRYRQEAARLCAQCALSLLDFSQVELARYAARVAVRFDPQDREAGEVLRRTERIIESGKRVRQVCGLSGQPVFVLVTGSRLYFGAGSDLGELDLETGEPGRLVRLGDLQVEDACLGQGYICGNASRREGREEWAYSSR